MKEITQVLLIAVNYRSDDDTISFVGDVLRHHDIEGLHILIVDNSESPPGHHTCADVMRGMGAKVSVYTPHANLGYYGGAAWGLEKYLQSNPMPEWVIVSNVDLRVPGEAFLERLIQYGGGHKHAVVAPSIISEFSKEAQNPYMRVRPSLWRMRFYKLVFRYYPALVAYSMLSLIFGRIRSVKNNSNPCELAGVGANREPVEIYAGHGSFLAFRRTYFAAGGDLTHGTFLFGEEIFIAETVRRLGLTIGYDPRLRLIHREHQTTGYFPSRKIGRYLSQSASYCADTFFRT